MNHTAIVRAIATLLEEGLEEQAITTERLANEKGTYVGSVQAEKELMRFKTCDPDMLALKDTVRNLIRYNDSVLILGETGTGKEIIARALHGSRGILGDSKATVGRFVGINCTALSPDLMSSELFGHVKGAFTGAVEDRVGKLQSAYKGTLFIDEIGDMSLGMQAALLRALQERVIVRVGDNKEIPVEFRLVCATHRDIQEMVTEGSFREDLYYRISTFELRTKPLRKRLDDIPLIIKGLDPAGHFPISKFMERFASDDWVIQLSGNVRELERIVRRYLVLGDL